MTAPEPEPALFRHQRGAVDGDLAMLDPTLFERGFYTLRLTARDVAGRVGIAQIYLELAAEAGGARYVREDSDFALTLGGHTLDFTRRYDSGAADVAEFLVRA